MTLAPFSLSLKRSDFYTKSKSDHTKAKFETILLITPIQQRSLIVMLINSTTVIAATILIV